MEPLPTGTFRTKSLPVVEICLGEMTYLAYQMDWNGEQGQRWAEEIARLHGYRIGTVHYVPYPVDRLAWRGGCPKGYYLYAQAVETDLPISRQVIDHCHGRVEWAILEPLRLDLPHPDQECRS